MGCSWHLHRKADANNVHSISCNDSIGGCYRAALEACPTGYEIDHVDSYRTPYDGVDTFPLGLVINRQAYSLLIECDTSGANREQEKLKSALAQQCIDECVTTTAKSPDACFDSCIEQID